MTTARRLHFSYAEYLQALSVSELKLEFCDGVIYAMAVGTVAHAELSARIIRLLGNALPPGCHVYSSDLKVRIEETDLSAFPDASVVCGSTQTSPLDPNAVTNPTLLIEVTSRSTEDYDRGDKLGHYKQLPSLRAVLFVSHRRKQVTVVERTDGAWQEREVRGGETVSFGDPALQLPVDALYEGIDLGTHDASTRSPT